MPRSKMNENLLKLSFEDLRLLMEIDKLGAIGKAGAALNMSPSKASRRLSDIKSVIGDPCFVIGEGKVVPTPYFVSVRESILQILSNLELLSRRPFDPIECRRTFSVSCMMAEVTHVIGGVLSKFIKMAPKARLHLSKIENEFAAVISGQTDFAIVTAVDLPPEVHSLKLYPLDRVILLRKGHPLTKLKRPLQKFDLQGYDRVTILTGRTNAWTGPDQNLFPYEKYMEHTRFSTSRFNAAWEAMESTDLIAACGFRAAEIAMRAYNLTFVNLPEDFEETNHWNRLIWSERTHKDDACIWFRHLFAEWAKDEEERIQKLIASGKGPKRVPPP